MVRVPCCECKPLPSALCLVLMAAMLVACTAPVASEQAAGGDDAWLQRHDPKACADCHPRHYRDWSGSMHAYASTDPVFRAMNARGQRETQGELGDFCIRCHAPLAVALDRSQDGLNLDELSPALQGVGCSFCHAVVDAGPDGHNNPLRVALDEGFGGPFGEAAANDFHRSRYSPWLDGRRAEGSRMCGSCHDVVVPSGLHLERTYAEWRQGAHAAAGMGCQDCHMPASPGYVSAGREGPKRIVHNHAMPAIDTALTPFPEREAQRLSIQAMLDDSLSARMCVETAGEVATVRIMLRNRNAAHSFPSGSAQDRRVTVELKALLKSGKTWQDRSWVLGNRIFDRQGMAVHMFWQAATLQGQLLEAPQSFVEGTVAFDQTAQTRSYTLAKDIDSLSLRVTLTAMHQDVLDDLVASKDLNRDALEDMPVFLLNNVALDWSAGDEPCVASLR